MAQEQRDYHVQLEHSTTDGQAVFRDPVKEGHEDYFVVYQPADARFPFALVDISFPGTLPEAEAIRRLMERELSHWLERYPVPVMVSSFDATGSLVNPSECPCGSHLTGHVATATGDVVKRWGGFEEEQLPPEQRDAAYLVQVYKDVPLRYKEQVSKKAIAQARTLARAARVMRLAVLLLVVVPLLLEMVAWGVAWLGHVLAGISLLTGLYRIGKTLGWAKPSQREKDEDERRRKMEHYYYHCERNPRGFELLRTANFDEDAIAQTRQEAQELRAKAKGVQ